MEVELHNRKGISGKVILDPEDAQLAGLVWNRITSKRGRTGERQLTYFSGLIDGKRQLMHRVIVGATRQVEFVDHINGNTLDNRRCNLRIVSRSENALNQHVPTNRYKGVGLAGSRSRSFKATLQVRGVTYTASPFSTAEEAAVAYNSLALAFGGGFVRLNDIKGIDNSTN